MRFARDERTRVTESHREILIEIKRGAINIRVSRQQIKRQPFPARHLDQPWTEISIESSEISRRPFLASLDPESTKAHRDCFSRDNVVGGRRAFRERESRARPIIAKLMKLFQESSFKKGNPREHRRLPCRSLSCPCTIHHAMFLALHPASSLLSVSIAITFPPR